jgi:diguanylate cyclase (GGDEF)-like protein/PAS domain S-box-containing protein
MGEGKHPARWLDHEPAIDPLSAPISRETPDAGSNPTDSSRTQLELDALFAEGQRRDQLSRVVSSGIDRLLTANSVKGILSEVLESIAKVVHIERVQVMEVMGTLDGRPLNVVYHSWLAPGVEQQFNPVADVKYKDDIERAAVLEWASPTRDGMSVFASQHTGAAALRGFLARIKVISLLVVPIMVGGRQWGNISFDDCHSEREWTSDEIDTLKLMANVIGVAITRERSMLEVRARDALLQAVTLSACEIMTSPSLRDAISNSLERVAKSMRADRMMVLEVQRPSEGPPRLLCRSSWNTQNAPIEIDQMLRIITGPHAAEHFSWAAPLHRGMAVHSTLSTATPGLKEYFARFGVQSTLIVPIMVNGRYWGQIGLDDCHSERVWTNADIEILKTLAELIGTAITRERYTEELVNANTIIQNSPTILYRLRGEPSFPLIYVSQNVSLLGYDANELLESPTLCQSYVHPEDRTRVQATMAQLLHHNAPPVTIEYRMLSGSGENRWIENRFTPVHDAYGLLREVEGIIIDITERKIADEKITQLARTDALTGLANRATFGDRLRHAFAGAKRGANSFAALYLDLDRFKEVNDALGHPIGDRVLQAAAERLRDAVRETDVIARLGGDEFAVLQMDVAEPSAAGTLAEKIIDTVSRPYLIDGNELRIGVSVGVAMYSASVADPDEVLEQADKALYRAKDESRGHYCFHTAQLDAETRERVTLVEDLRLALERQELELYYQPQVELSTGRVAGMEALIRWNHPSRGLLLPREFLPIAEKSGAMQAVGRWVLDGACRQLRQWRDAQVEVPLIAVNIGLAQIRAGREFVKDVKDSLTRWSLTPQDLELDVTELILARATLAQSNVLEELHQLGVLIAIDDFGTQYSSLDYLRTYHVSRLKIARHMVKAVTDESADSMMIRAIMGLAAELGVDVIAEGVETEEQRRHFVNLGAHTKGQGHLFSTAMPATAALESLRTSTIIPK